MVDGVQVLWEYLTASGPGAAAMALYALVGTRVRREPLASPKRGTETEQAVENATPSIWIEVMDVL